LVLPRNRGDDLRPVRDRLLHVGSLHAAELRRHHRWHAGDRPARNGEQLAADDARSLSDAVAASGSRAMNIRVADIPAKTVGRIDVANVSISLGEGADAFEAVRDLNFAVAPGELVCV